MAGKTSITVIPGERPTVRQVAQWPPTVSVAQAALAMGISRAHAYRLIAQGGNAFPVETEKMGNRRVVMTASLLRWLRLRDRTAG